MNYTIMEVTDAVKAGCKDLDAIDISEGLLGPCDGTPSFGIFESTDSGIGRLIAIDGGEPEDQTFYRGLGWIPKELQKAFDTGFEKGKLSRESEHDERVIH